MVKRPHEYFMAEAIREAVKAGDNGDVPVGCVVVHGGEVISRGHNQVELLKDPTAHAEMIAITSACERLGSKWLLEASVYVTIEPCSMCSGALVLARVKNLIYGAADPKTGGCGSVFNIIDNKCLNHRVNVTKGMFEEQCALLVSEFFRQKRAVRS